MTNVELNQLKTRLYIALKPHLGDAEATEKAIAEFAQKHDIPQEEVQRMADEQTAYREKFKAERSPKGPATEPLPRHRGGVHLHKLGQGETIGQSTLTSNDVETQQQRLLVYLHEHGSCSTNEASQPPLDIMRPAARIFELRNQGIDIATVWTTVATAYGKPRRIARYDLLAGGAL